MGLDTRVCSCPVCMGTCSGGSCPTRLCRSCFLGRNMFASHLLDHRYMCVQELPCVLITCMLRSCSEGRDPHSNTSSLTHGHRCARAALHGHRCGQENM